MQTSILRLRFWLNSIQLVWNLILRLGMLGGMGIEHSCAVSITGIYVEDQKTNILFSKGIYRPFKTISTRISEQGLKEYPRPVSSPKV